MAPPKGSTRNPSGFKASNGDASTSSLAESLSYALIPKPFKDERSKKLGTRRNKTLKQILAAEKIRANQVLSLKIVDDDTEINLDDQAINNNQASSQLPSTQSNLKKSKKEPAPSVNPDVNYMAYTAIEAPPSVVPPRKYCDVTGLAAPYADPKTRLRYHNAEVYELIKNFGPGVDQIYLSLRGAHTTLR